MSDAVTFSYVVWKARYPEFSAVSEPLAQSYFDEAGLYWRNDGTSMAPNAAIQSTLLNMMTAHIAALYVQSQGSLAPGTAQDAGSPVGRISSATEGSVTVQTELPDPANPSAMYAWLSQTKYGLSFWAATAPYRTAGYIQGSLQPGGLPAPQPGAFYFNGRTNRW